MARVQVEIERIVAAGPGEVYELLRDYRGRRRAIAPPEIEDYQVEEGGESAGTLHRYRLRAGRRRRTYRVRVEEPVKGRTLRERDLQSSFVMTWELTPAGDGGQTRIRLASEWEGAAGLAGFFKRRFAPLALRRIYAAMLERFARELKRA
jgi:uncharacterized protein YndB with AHSA1/START domain